MILFLLALPWLFSKQWRFGPKETDSPAAVAYSFNDRKVPVTALASFDSQESRAVVVGVSFICQCKNILMRKIHMGLVRIAMDCHDLYGNLGVDYSVHIHY